MSVTSKLTYTKARTSLDKLNGLNWAMYKSQILSYNIMLNVVIFYVIMLNVVGPFYACPIKNFFAQNLRIEKLQ